jgi:hypothetical protein
MTRIAHKQSLPEFQPPTVLGVDDWAFRKGVKYGTVLVDLETSRPIELLASRDSEALKAWLTGFPNVKIVTRDRSGAYSSALNEICPNAVQVADRFHLLMNLTDALDTYFKGVNREVSRLIKDKTNEILAIPAIGELPLNQEDQEFQSIPEPAKVLEIKVDQRLDNYNKVKELQAMGTPLRRIAKMLGISRNTVRSYFIQESLVPKGHPRSINIERYRVNILSRLAVRGHKKSDIYNEIVQLGYNGGTTQAYDYMKQLQLENGLNPSDSVAVQREMTPYLKPLSSKKMARYIGTNFLEIQDATERRCMETIIAHSPELQIVRRLVQVFRTMFLRGCGNIKRWIDFVLHSKHKLPGLKSFANGLLRDLQAVENGVSMGWSNGPVEGHVNRIKSIKRGMYGRAGFELLRRKVILSQTG